MQYGCESIQSNTIDSTSNASVNPTTANVEDILLEAATLSNASQSTKASKLVAQSILYHPQNAQLSAALSTYQKLSKQEISWLESDALIKHALWIRSELRKESIVVIAKPSIWTNIRISHLKVKQNHAHEKLIQCAKESIEHKPNLSRRCLDATNKGQLTDQQHEHILAFRNRLHENEILNTINQAPPQEPTSSQASEALPPELTQASKSLQPVTLQAINALKKALSEKDYLRAKQLRNSLLENEIENNQEAENLIRVTDKRIKAYIDSTARRADALYLQEKVAEADALWMLLIKLGAENDDYRQNHERAAKILKNIRTIKEENKTGDSPANLKLSTPD